MPEQQSQSSQTPTPTPPPLYYSPSPEQSSDKGRTRESTSDSNTPVHTPKVGEQPWPPTSSFGLIHHQHHPHHHQQHHSSSSAAAAGKKDREKDLYFSWHRKAGTAGAAHRHSNPLLGSEWHFTQQHFTTASDQSDDALFDADFPLFPDSPPPSLRNSPHPSAMTSAAPIDISLPPRLSSASPRNHTSNLTFALQEAGASGQPAHDHDVNGSNPGGLAVGQRSDSIGNLFGGGSYYGGSGARPISVKDRQRRESNTAGSFMGGISWGGMSLGTNSWVQNE
jgi:transcription factor SFP1